MQDRTKKLTCSEDLTELTFVGGPFDGFVEAVSADEELPECIALPMNERAGKIFGIQFCTGRLPRVAVYQLENQAGGAAYSFRGMRLA